MAFRRFMVKKQNRKIRVEKMTWYVYTVSVTYEDKTDDRKNRNKPVMVTRL